MAVKNKQKKEKAILENPEVLAERLTSAEHFVEKNKITVLIVTGIVVAFIAGLVGYKYYTTVQNEEAQAEMFQAVYYYEKDSLNKALNGDGQNLGFLDISNKYGMTKAGNLSNYYIGLIYLKQGDFKNAIEFLNDFESSDDLVQARAYSLTGDAYMELENYKDAVKYYKKASEYKANKFFTPSYLMKLGLAYEKSGSFNDAVKAYDEIIEKYYDAAEFNDARKQKARAQALATK